MTIAPHDRESQRPTRRQAASSPTALTNLIAAFLLLSGFFLPHSVDCDDRSHRPIDIALSIAAETTDASGYLALTVFWPFLFAGLTIVIMLTLVLLRPSWTEYGLLALPIFTAAGLSVAWILLLFSARDGSRLAMIIAVIVLPPVACVATRMVWLSRSGHIAAAAAWGQGLVCVLAAFSLRWFWCPTVVRMLWGGLLSIAAAVLMMLASWCWIYRARYDLSDRSTAPMPMQVSLVQVLGGITITAIALSYWRYLGSS